VEYRIEGSSSPEMSSSHGSPHNGRFSNKLQTRTLLAWAQELLAEALQSHKHRFSMIMQVAKIICIVIMGACDPFPIPGTCT
jgi:hypothetical protein